MSRSLFILAGSSGSGKTSLIQSSRRGNIKIFGAKHHDKFIASIQHEDIGEYKDFKTAYSKGSYFHGKHIPDLDSITDLPSNVLLHLDLSRLLRTIVLYPVVQLRQVTWSSIQHRTDTDLLNRAENDKLLSRFLTEGFFSRFSEIHLATLYCEGDEVFRRLSNRRGEASERSTPSDGWTEIHRETYAFWFRNLNKIGPTISALLLSPDGKVLLRNGRIVHSDYINAGLDSATP